MRDWLEGLGTLPSLLIAGSSGFIVALGAPPDGWLWASWVGFLPLLLIATREKTTLRQAMLFGFVGGLGIGLGGFPWISEMLVKFARVPTVVGWLGLLGFSAWMAIPYGLWSVGLRAGPRDGWAGVAWAAVLFSALQFVWPALFPYTPFLGFAETPELMQLAEVAGVHGVEAVVIAATVLLLRGSLASTPTARLANVGACASIAIAMYFAGGLRMASLDAEAQSAPTIRVGIVQPNIGIRRAGFDTQMERLRAPSRIAEEQGAELIVWPEAGVLPFAVSRPFRGDSKSSRRRILEQHRTPTVFGAGSREKDARFGFNSAYFIDAEGRPRGSYDKVNLVPLGEAIPIVDPDWVTDRIPQIAHHEAGELPARFVLERGAAAGPDVAFAPLICFEDIIPGYVREAAEQDGGVSLFVNLTIDAWYGDSAEPWEHLALAQFRAVEHRVPIVRSVSTGVSAVVDYNGRLIAHIPLRPVTSKNLGDYPPELLVETIAMPRNTAEHPTVYARVGWLFPYLCCLVVVLGGLQIYLQSRDGQ